MTTHVNVYGPAACGKTRNAERLRKKFGCAQIIDEGKLPPGRIDIPRKGGKALILTQQPIRANGVSTIPFAEAIR